MSDYGYEINNWHDDDADAEGYECQHCGYIPTRAELRLGLCPRCAEAKRKEKHPAEREAISQPR